MTKAAAAIVRDKCSGEAVADRVTPTRARPGWVLELVIAVLADANHPLRPQEVIRQVERIHGRPIAPSSIRNCLREAAKRTDSSIERLGYGRYGLRPAV